VCKCGKCLVDKVGNMREAKREMDERDGWMGWFYIY
jgi:hypothetical protein